MKRRDFIKRSGMSALTVWGGSSFLFSGCHTEEDMIGESNWIVEGSFDRALPLPSSLTGGGSLNAQFSTSEILKGKVTTTLSYAEGQPGPVIRANKGETVNINLTNHLSEETNIHWHGLVLPEDMDGHPRDVAAAGGSLPYSLPIIQRAGTYWYHPHPHGATARQVFMGLAGLFIVSDEEETRLNLPQGEYEIPLIIQDKHFEGNSLDYSPNEDEMMTGYLGEHVIVNGAYAPFQNVAAGWYRLRMLNGSTARVYNLTFSHGIRMNIIGSDGGLLRSSQEVSSILLGPGERLDVLVDFSSVTIGSEVYLASSKFSTYHPQGRQSFNLMKFKVERRSEFQFSLPSQLSDIPVLNDNNALMTRTFDISAMINASGGSMGRHSINGKTFETERIDETVQADSTEVWVFDNMAGDEIHPMHIHGVQFQILERIGGRNEVTPAETGWKDTVLVMPGEKVKVIMTFPQYTGVFVFHCHNLEHEDDGMMLNYRIV